jgi:hypothetical protein
VLEFSVKLESNPAFTASVLLAYARAACRDSAEDILLDRRKALVLFILIFESDHSFLS